MSSLPTVLRKLKVVATRKVKVRVNFGVPLEELVQAGHYDYVNSNVTSANFPATGQGQVEQEIELIQFNVGPESDEVEAYFKANGLQSAGMRHCLAVGSQHPELQRQLLMAFLKDAWRGPFGPEVGVLSGLAGRRGLNLLPRAGGWDQDYWFAALRA